MIFINMKGTTSVYQLKDKVHLYTIHRSSSDCLSYVNCFEGKILLTYLNHFEEYNKDGVLMAQGKKDVQEEVYFYT